MEKMSKEVQEEEGVGALLKKYFKIIDVCFVMYQVLIGGYHKKLLAIILFFGEMELRRTTC